MFEMPAYFQIQQLRLLARNIILLAGAAALINVLVVSWAASLPLVIVAAVAVFGYFVLGINEDTMFKMAVNANTMLVDGTAVFPLKGRSNRKRYYQKLAKVLPGTHDLQVAVLAAAYVFFAGIGVIHETVLNVMVPVIMIGVAAVVRYYFVYKVDEDKVKGQAKRVLQGTYLASGEEVFDFDGVKYIERTSLDGRMTQTMELVAGMDDYLYACREAMLGKLFMDDVTYPVFADFVKAEAPVAPVAETAKPAKGGGKTGPVPVPDAA